MGKIFYVMGKSASGKDTIYKTVSYTHLDVYKRQFMTCVSTCAASVAQVFIYLNNSSDHSFILLVMSTLANGCYERSIQWRGRIVCCYNNISYVDFYHFLKQA